MRQFKTKRYNIPLGKKTLVMGVVNITPDSFSDGGETFSPKAALDRALRQIDEGADIIDVGGESTRPGSRPVSLEEELNRVIPVIDVMNGRVSVPISIDTYKSQVAEEALKSGADIVNDISGGTFDPKMPAVVNAYNAGAVLMHIKGAPRDMQKNPDYADLLGEIYAFLAKAVNRFTAAGVRKEQILVDPGIGFGKRLSHNLELLRNPQKFADLASGVLIGPSRKSSLGKITGADVKDRLPESIAAAVCAAIYGADVVRVHDVREVQKALRIAGAVMGKLVFDEK